MAAYRTLVHRAGDDYHETGVVQYEGRTFKASGGSISATHAAGYSAFATGDEQSHRGYKGVPSQGTAVVLNDWGGRKLGLGHIISCWKTPKSWQSPYTCQMTFLLNKKLYTGRGSPGMLWRGKLKK